ncbi:pilus assembly protein PilZ, partial [Klebsiella pneumoniae]
DFAEFHIQTHRKIPSGHKIRFLLHSDSNNADVSLYHHLVCRLTRLV